MKNRLVCVVAALCLLAGCGHAPTSHDTLSVVTTTPILADLTRHVAGDRATVTSLVPSGADPHTYEPSLRDVRTVVYSKVALSNYLMLEPHSVIKTIDASLPAGSVNVSLAEEAQKYGAEVIPLVENANLDTVWLGLRVMGKGTAQGADRSSSVHLQLTSVDGPGYLTAYITGTFGRPHIYYSTADGIDERDDVELPTDAHTHMSWAFSAPGVYKATFTATLSTARGNTSIGTQTLTIAVGADPRTIPELADRTVIDKGHADVAADIDDNTMTLLSDPTGGGVRTQKRLNLDTSVIWVPPKALTEIPPSPTFRFLGRPGSSIHQLPQAVLGVHVHGEIDPHLWMSIKNTKAYVQVIRDTLIKADPLGAQTYRENTSTYLAQLDETSRYVDRTIATIPRGRRQLITSHDAYGYLAQAHGIQIAGFISSNPGVEPSMAQRRKLDQTIADLKVPAVFLEPTVLRDSSVLAAIAAEHSVKVCPIYGDTFDNRVTTYIDLMKFDADSLAACLG
ncbi:anchored repeat ABC transporter, substrate-binding protein [Cutibacterium sp. WCA-380-WT-3A]|uniref:Anchored repeat ABC transporter, substrate-binding protein n=1 Tax=Cutibacterium porci TaxID=2605781 RepID=A0A7K0J965_9ACTN|nr:anchored repeat ABC transporter, substrate-binding protein [Cutibacterium porci]MSS46499.1 anchored repeat ABC transporter, substrate-binding protein [Cutibacterium porci]